MTNDRTPPIRNLITSAFAGVNIRPELAGEGYINWLRCSNVGQSDTSPDGQKEVNDAYCAVQRMRWASYDVYAEGVSGSQTFNREDIAEILHLKRTRNDFTKVVVFELGRATRGGVRHGNVVEDELRKAGIELISSTELIPDGPVGELIKAVKHFGNQQQAQNISKSVARGLAQSLAKSTRPSAGRTPLGLDRLYLAPDGAPRTLIRWEGLVQLRIDPKTNEIVSRAVRNPPRKPRAKGERRPAERPKRFVGYKKQDDETSVLVPGGGAAADAVRSIHRWYHVEGLGSHKIIQRLRAANLRPAGGGAWNLSAVHHILENPIYIGREVRHRWTKALYHKLGPDGPVPVTVDQDALEEAGKKCVPQTERPRDEWVLTDKPLLKDFLPPDVREAATAYLARRLDADVVTAKQARWAKRKHKSDDNPYVLSHVLRSKQSKKPMRGDTNSRRRASGERHVTRYYFDYSTASEAVSGLNARRVPAVPLEDAVVPAVFEALLDRPWVERCVREYVASLRDGVRDLDAERRALTEEREEISRRLKRIHKTSGHLTDEELEALVAEDNDRIVAIRRALAQLERHEERRPPTADEAVAAVAERLSALPADWRSLPNREVKELLSKVVERLEIDLATLDVRLSVVLPQAAVEAEAAPKAQQRGRVNFASLWPSVPDATASAGLKLAEVACEHDHKAKCYTCRRSGRAA